MLLVICNCPPRVAEEIGREIVENNLAASVNLVPGVKRTFREINSLSVQEETMMLIQTLEEKLERLTEKITEMYPSEIPAIISIPIYEGSGQYINWVENNLLEE